MVKEIYKRNLYRAEVSTGSGTVSTFSLRGSVDVISSVQRRDVVSPSVDKKPLRAEAGKLHPWERARKVHAGSCLVYQLPLLSSQERAYLALDSRGRTEGQMSCLATSHYQLPLKTNQP